MFWFLVEIRTRWLVYVLYYTPIMCFMMAIIHCTNGRSRYRVAEGTRGTWQIYYIYIWTSGIPINTLTKNTSYYYYCASNTNEFVFLLRSNTPTTPYFVFDYIYVYCDITITCASTFSVLYLQTVREDEVNEYNMVHHRVKYILKCLSRFGLL